MERENHFVLLNGVIEVCVCERERERETEREREKIECATIIKRGLRA
jgi:hypothetical protein